MAQTGKSVFSFLSDSSAAIRHGKLDLGFGRSSAIWSNAQDNVRYDNSQGHAFSLYLREGHDVWRVDGTPKHGWPGAFCLFPHGHSSDWEIKGSLTFLHLYLPDEELRRCYSEMMDRDGRLLQLADVTYAEPEGLEAPFTSLFNAMSQGDSLKAEEAMMDLVASVLSQKRFHDIAPKVIKGGLSRGVQARLKDFIESHLDQTIRLEDLAQIAGLSEFHLQRSFKQSCGVSPHLYVSHRRIERAKEMIKAGEPLAQIADGCGFSSQAHFSRSFRVGTGVTPAGYRKAIA